MSAVYHCISRIVGADFLLEGEREKEVLRNQLWKVADFCGIEVLTYCIMSNHVHILVRTPDPTLQKRIPNSELIRRAKRIYDPERASSFEQGLTDPENEVRDRFRAQLLSRMGDVSQYMKELKQRFSIWYNRTHLRVGTLWAERFKSVLVEDEPMALATVASYIELNPVRAGIASDPAEYRFCGYAEAMGGFKPARAGVERIVGSRGNWAEAIARYRMVIFGKAASASGTGRSIDPERVALVMRQGGKVARHEALRCRIRYFTDGAVIGSAEFVQRVIEARGMLFGNLKRAGPRELSGSDWDGLNCARGLRKAVFGSG